MQPEFFFYLFIGKIPRIDFLIYYNYWRKRRRECILVNWQSFLYQIDAVIYNSVKQVICWLTSISIQLNDRHAGRVIAHSKCEAPLASDFDMWSLSYVWSCSWHSRMSSEQCSMQSYIVHRNVLTSECSLSTVNFIRMLLKGYESSLAYMQTLLLICAPWHYSTTTQIRLYIFYTCLSIFSVFFSIQCIYT